MLLNDSACFCAERNYIGKFWIFLHFFIINIYKFLIKNLYFEKKLPISY